MKCPKCTTTIIAKPDEAGFLKCPSCGARLRTKTQAVFTAKSGTYTPPRPLPAVSPPAEAAADDSLAQEAARQVSADATIPRGMGLPRIPRPGEVAAAPTVPVPQTPAAPEGPATLETVLSEIRAVRQTQTEILALLRQRPGTFAPALKVGASARPATALVIDDDAETRDTAAKAIERAGVRVKTVPDGNDALIAIARETPGVVVLELDLGGSMPGKDLINRLKAKREWVDIPLVLHTRVALASEDEARTLHGADHYVKKGRRSAEALAAHLKRTVGTR